MIGGQFTTSSLDQMSFENLVPPIPGRGPAVLITGGITIGNMTNNGGLAALFDGLTDVPTSNAARRSSGNSGYGGKNLTGSPVAFSHAIVWSTNNVGFCSDANPTISLDIRGKNGAPPNSTGTDGDILGSWSGPDANSISPQIDSLDTNTPWEYLWVHITRGGSSGEVTIAELELFGWPS